MVISLLLVLMSLLALVFFILWIRERRRIAQAEIVAYGLRAQDSVDENTKTNMRVLEAEYDAALDRLTQLGEIQQDNWGRWVWRKTGEQLAERD